MNPTDMSDAIEDLLKTSARLAKFYLNELEQAGFTREEAMQIIVAQGGAVGVKV